MSVNAKKMYSYDKDDLVTVIGDFTAFLQLINYYLFPVGTLKSFIYQHTMNGIDLEQSL